MCNAIVTTFHSNLFLLTINQQKNTAQWMQGSLPPELGALLMHQRYGMCRNENQTCSMQASLHSAEASTDLFKDTCVHFYLMVLSFRVLWWHSPAFQRFQLLSVLSRLHISLYHCYLVSATAASDYSAYFKVIHCSMDFVCSHTFYRKRQACMHLSSLLRQNNVVRVS